MAKPNNFSAAKLDLVIEAVVASITLFANLLKQLAAVLGDTHVREWALDSCVIYE